MPNFPVTHLVIGSSYTVVGAGPHLQVLDSRTGHVLFSENTGLPVRQLAVDDAFEHVVTSADDKKLTVWRRDGLQRLNSRDLAKKANVICFDRSNAIVVADKFGDVFRFPLLPTPGAGSNAPHTSELLLGHVSIITALQLSRDGRYVVTGDRDEHVRVSWYPEGWQIERFLFGHRKFVSALCMPSFDPSCLISGGGDPDLFVWDWQTGDLKAKLPFESVARPFIRVKANKKQQQQMGRDKKRKPGRSDPLDQDNPAEGERDEQSDGGEPEEVDEPRNETNGANGDGADEADGMEVDDDGERPETEAAPTDAAIESPIAIRKIACMERDDGNLVLFSLTGCSALFYLPYSCLLIPSTDLQALDLGKPILDFAVHGAQVWLSVDVNWGVEATGDDVSVHLAEWNAGLLVPASRESTPLLAGLTECAKNASPADLEALELYSDLVLLPKYGEQDADQDGEDKPVPAKRRTGAKADGRRKTQAALAGLTEDAGRGKGKRRKVDAE